MVYKKVKSGTIFITGGNLKNLPHFGTTGTVYLITGMAVCFWPMVASSARHICVIVFS